MARILIAEDEPDVREFVMRGLTMAGHTVDAVADGGAAVAALKQAGEPFDLLLSDIRMPVMDGIQLALSVARDWPDIPILLMTGYADQKERARGLDSLIFDVLNKPFTLADLISNVARALENPPVGDSVPPGPV